MFKHPGIRWIETEVRWYKGKMRRIAYATMTCMWGAQGQSPLPIRLVLLKDLAGEYEPIALMGVETQRQWSDKAIARTTPALFALYSIVCLIADSFQKIAPLKNSKTAWYKKESITFADLLGEVRRHLWEHRYFNILYGGGDHEKIFPPEYAAILMDQLAEVA